eukprot:12409456-Karenia_brevis.AAC.1
MEQNLCKQSPYIRSLPLTEKHTPQTSDAEPRYIRLQSDFPEPYSWEVSQLAAAEGLYKEAGVHAGRPFFRKAVAFVSGAYIDGSFQEC